MPDRWRRSLSGSSEPDLRGTKVLSDSCLLWLPRGSAMARAQSWGGLSLLAKAGLLASPLRKLPHEAWPDVLRESALAVYALDEPVIVTGSFLSALAASYRDAIFLYDAVALQFSSDSVQIGDLRLRPRAIVLAAGAGNGELLRRAGIETALMQSRPLGMVLLRGELPSLFGHCVVGGKTGLTITTPAPGVWQIGGEVAERLASEKNDAAARALALEEIHRWLPRLNLWRAEIAIYRAVRAEALTAAQRRPSGVHASRVAPALAVAWPTKLSMAPVLADEIFDILRDDLKAPGGYTEAPRWPSPKVARYPWEEAQWFAVN